MKIIINGDKDGNMCLRVPAGLFLNPFGALFLPGMAKRYGVKISKRQASILVKGIRDYKRSCPEWKLVEIESADGESIQIIL